MLLYYMFMCFVVTIICAWAVVSPRVTAGVLTKATLGLMSISSFASAGWVWTIALKPTQSELMFVTAAAIIACRCYWIKTVKPSIRKYRRNH